MSCQRTLVERCRDADHLALATCPLLTTMSEPTRCNACTNIEGAISRLSLFVLVSQTAFVPYEWRPKKYVAATTPDPMDGEYVSGPGT